jgi:hypothetical protein
MPVILDDNLSIEGWSGRKICRSGQSVGVVG